MANTGVASMMVEGRNRIKKTVYTNKLEEKHQINQQATTQISMNTGALVRLYLYLYFIVVRSKFATAGPDFISITANKFRLYIRFGFRGFGVSSSLVPEPGRRHFAHPLPIPMCFQKYSLTGLSTYMVLKAFEPVSFSDNHVSLMTSQNAKLTSQLSKSPPYWIPDLGFQKISK